MVKLSKLNLLGSVDQGGLMHFFVEVLIVLT